MSRTRGASSRCRSSGHLLLVVVFGEQAAGPVVGVVPGHPSSLREGAALLLGPDVTGVTQRAAREYRSLALGAAPGVLVGFGGVYAPACALVGGVHQNGGSQTGSCWVWRAQGSSWTIWRGAGCCGASCGACGACCVGWGLTIIYICEQKRQEANTQAVSGLQKIDRKGEKKWIN